MTTTRFLLNGVFLFPSALPHCSMFWEPEPSNRRLYYLLAPCLIWLSGTTQRKKNWSFPKGSLGPVRWSLYTQLCLPPMPLPHPLGPRIRRTWLLPSQDRYTLGSPCHVPSMDVTCFLSILGWIERKLRLLNTHLTIYYPVITLLLAPLLWQLPQCIKDNLRIFHDSLKLTLDLEH